MTYDRHENAKRIMERDVDRAIAKGEIRPHEREKTIELAANNWRGRVQQGQAVQAAIDAVKKGLA